MTLRDPDRFDKLIAERHAAVSTRDKWTEVIKRIDTELAEIMWLDSAMRSITRTEYDDSSTTGEGDNLPRSGPGEHEEVRYYRGTPEGDGRTL